MITGAGLGAVMSNFIVAAQNVVMDRRDMGVASGSMSLFRSIGGTVGVAIIGGVINARMLRELSSNFTAEQLANLPADASSIGQLLLITTNPPIPDYILDIIRESLSNSITYAFFISAWIVLAVVVVSLMIRRVPLKSADEYHGQAEDVRIRSEAEKPVLELARIEEKVVK